MKKAFDRYTDPYEPESVAHHSPTPERSPGAFGGAAAEAAPPGQAAEVNLRLTNESDATICYVFIADPTDADWGDERLGKDSIAPGGSYTVTVSTGHYHVLFLDCDGKVLLHRRGIDLRSDAEVTLTELDIRNSECDANNDRGWTLDLGGSYAEALTVFQEVVACYRGVGIAPVKRLRSTTWGLCIAT